MGMNVVWGGKGKEVMEGHGKEILLLGNGYC